MHCVFAPVQHKVTRLLPIEGPEQVPTKALQLDEGWNVVGTEGVTGLWKA